MAGLGGGSAPPFPSVWRLRFRHLDWPHAVEGQCPARAGSHGLRLGHPCWT
jgi:hypothetical protein